MSNNIRFTKMHGAGNDYLYVNTLLYKVPDPERASIVWSARHTGVGSDGLVLIGEPKDRDAADFSMRIFNADGSEAMMCGNASRCIGKYLYEKNICRKDEIRLETLSGVKVLRLHFDSDSDPETVTSETVDMLEPRTDVPEQFTGTAPTHDVPGFRSARFVSMGNPHYVIFVDDIKGLDIASHGVLLEHSPEFPERCNIEFAQILPDGSIRTRVWERGSGITMACGTGACATAVAASLLGLAPRESDIIMDGGTLHICWSPTDGHVYMTGPAAFVCDGEIALPE
ncbi:MAG: diaminopimelate epimerase [Prevotella sp.]|nr:diaminopimelate epimerase [Prevotella sp.]